MSSIVTATDPVIWATAAEPLARHVPPDPRQRFQLVQDLEAATDTPAGAIALVLDALVAGLDSPSPEDQIKLIRQELHRQGALARQRGESLQSITHTARGALLQAWGGLRALAAEQDWTCDRVGLVGEAFIIARFHALAAVTRGYETNPSARADLIHALLCPAAKQTQDHLAQLAADAQWEMPDQVAVFRVHHEPSAVTDLIPPGVLLDLGTTPTRLIVPAADVVATAYALARFLGDARVTVSPLVSTREVPEADRWAQRALQLVDDGVLEPRLVTWCSDHYPTLILHAEPELRRQLMNELLAPLLNTRPAIRLAFAETLLAWLTTRGSSHTIAKQLGVHHQTVLYRLRRLKLMLGARVEDPRFHEAVPLLLQVALPTWQRASTQDATGESR